jgi:nucleotide-binding universal stress UspA family protein
MLLERCWPGAQPRRPTRHGLAFAGSGRSAAGPRDPPSRRSRRTLAPPGTAARLGSVTRAEQDGPGRVIAAIDSSAAAWPVLSAARALGELLHASAEALHVEKGLSATIRAVAARANLPLRVIEGAPAEEVALAAAEPDVVALVLGARATPEGRRPVGRTAQKLVLTMAKPAVVVPPQCAHPVRLSRWLIPLEASPVALEPLRELIERACAANSRITIVHVHEAPAIPAFEDQPHHEVSAWSREFLRRYCSHPESVEILLRVGPAREHVLAVAREVDADLIVLVWNQDLRPHRAMVVRDVLGGSPVPVLLVPARVRAAAAT